MAAAAVKMFLRGVTVDRVSRASGRVAALRGGRLAWARLCESWQRAASENRRKWITTLVAGFAACLVASLAVTLLAMRVAAAGALDWERGWLLDLERADTMPFHSALWLEGLGSSAMVVPVVAAAAIIAAMAGHGTRALLVLAAYVPAKALIFAGWLTWSRARPDFIADGVAVPPSLHSFPSGHTLQTITVYGVLTWFWIAASRSRIEQAVAWVLLAALCAAVALARLRLGTHWPSDVAAGALVGALWLGVLIFAQRRFEAS